jgi:hypothetical protein
MAFRSGSSNESLTNHISQNEPISGSSLIMCLIIVTHFCTNDSKDYINEWRVHFTETTFCNHSYYYKPNVRLCKSNAKHQLGIWGFQTLD